MDIHKRVEKIFKQIYDQGYKDGWKARTAKYEADNDIHHCRDCKWLCGEETVVGIECMSKVMQATWSEHSISRYHKPSDRACKRGFEQKKEDVV